jgi:hypothetical protein
MTGRENAHPELVEGCISLCGTDDPLPLRERELSFSKMCFAPLKLPLSIYEKKILVIARSVSDVAISAINKRW